MGVPHRYSFGNNKKIFNSDNWCRTPPPLFIILAIKFHSGDLFVLMLNIYLKVELTFGVCLYCSFQLCTRTHASTCTWLQIVFVCKKCTRIFQFFEESCSPNDIITSNTISLYVNKSKKNLLSTPVRFNRGSRGVIAREPNF